MYWCYCHVGSIEASSPPVQVAFLDVVHGSALLNLGSTQVRGAILDSWCVKRSKAAFAHIVQSSDIFARACLWAMARWRTLGAFQLSEIGVQVMSVATVGNDQDGLNIDTVHGPEMKRFMAHYSCPSFAVNEVRYQGFSTTPVLSLQCMLCAVLVSQTPLDARRYSCVAVSSVLSTACQSICQPSARSDTVVCTHLSDEGAHRRCKEGRSGRQPNF